LNYACEKSTTTLQITELDDRYLLNFPHITFHTNNFLITLACDVGKKDPIPLPFPPVERNLSFSTNSDVLILIATTSSMDDNSRYDAPNNQAGIYSESANDAA
jgi:hypothetical protein